MSIGVIALGQEKGYYSIGKNAEKLKTSGTQSVADSFVRVEKGYYSMNTNRNKLKRSTEKDTSTRTHVFPVSKGYYSIGNNGAKLVDRKE
jgi:hypothetical protein